MNNDEALKIYFQNLLSYVDYNGVIEEEDSDSNTIEADIDEIEFFEENFENFPCEDSIEEITSFIIVNDDENISTTDTLPDVSENFSDENTIISSDSLTGNEGLEPHDDCSLTDENIPIIDDDLPNVENLILDTTELQQDTYNPKDQPISILEENQSSLLHFYSTLNFSISILQRKNSHFLSSNSEFSEFEHLSLILDFSNQIKLKYTLSIDTPFDKITSIINNISILKSYIVYDINQNSYRLAIKGLIDKNISLLLNDTESEHLEKVSFEKVFDIKPSKPLQRVIPNKPIIIYPFNKKFLDEHKLCMNILNSNIKENFKIERKP